jgi:tricorn protease
VPADKGATQNLTQTSGAREKDAAFSPDGKKIAWISDESGEYEIYLRDASGKQPAVKLTSHRIGYRHTLRWSPDGKKIAFADQTLRCYVLDVATRKITEVDKAEFENIDVALDLKPIYDFHWSPDSRFLAYTKMNADLVNQIYIYALETGARHCASNGLFNDFWPVFSTDGKHLFFISNRRFDPTFCDFEWEMVYKKVAGIYCLTLEQSGAPLFPAGESPKPDSTANGKKDLRVTIDFPGLADRIEMLPVPAGNYRYLETADSELFYLNKNEGDFNQFEFREIGSMNLFAFNLEKQTERSVLEEIDAYKISANGEKIIFQKDQEIGLIATEAGAEKENLQLDDLKMWLIPREEWQQMYLEAWRMERDFFYDPQMHGHDWLALKEKYGQLIPLAACRSDLTYLIGELIGELSTSHTYVYGGDSKREADKVNVGMLGVDWGTDPANQRYYFKKIFRTPDWARKVLPPLAQPGLNVRDGEFLLQVNGKEVSTAENIYQYFQNLGDKTVTLLINEKPVLKGAREITVKTVTSEKSLRYQDWVEHNRQLVAEKSNGQIGYLHLPDTYTSSATEFPKYFYSQTRKPGLIVDGRFNGGGLDPAIFLQRLDKPIVAYWTRRYSYDQTSPSVATRAHKVLLTNRQAGSGGDELPYEFQRMKMGPVIGTRTWGGLVGISMFIELIDGGGVTVPDYRIYSPEGKWVVENEGITPDIEVPLKPAEVARGYDAQLMKGIEVLLEKIKTEPRPWPKHEAIPVDR